MHNKLATTAIALVIGVFALGGTAQAHGKKYQNYAKCLKTPPNPYGGTIAEAACDPAFEGIVGTLCVAVGAANPAIGEALSDPNAKLTVYAPTNEAFAAVPFLGTLLEPANQALLDNVLLYHVAAGKNVDPRRSAVIRKVPTLLEGQSLFFSYDFKVGAPMVNQSSASCEAVKATNGTIYIIDSVLQPQYFPAP